jgi:adenylate cyclase
MQRVCVLFNQANDRFLAEHTSPETRAVLEKAFVIISNLRKSLDVSSSINALFQIRIRIGANIGEVTIGNFGPDGAKQWDIVGLPVIDAKRMETTAPIGGLRISENLYRVLEDTGVVDEYYRRFKREAEALFGHYKDITKEELFRFSQVKIRDKKNAQFNTYSIQVNPGLPESVAEQVELLLMKERRGAERILELLQYYRGNRFILRAIEDLFVRKGIRIRKDYIFRVINPRKYRVLMDRLNSDRDAVRAFLDSEYSVYDLFSQLGRYQDVVKKDQEHEASESTEFSGYDSFLQMETRRITREYKRKRATMLRSAHFYNIVYPLVITSIFSSILEYQTEVSGVEELVETLEPIV